VYVPPTFAFRKSGPITDDRPTYKARDLHEASYRRKLLCTSEKTVGTLIIFWQVLAKPPRRAGAWSPLFSTTIKNRPDQAPCTRIPRWKSLTSFSFPDACGRHPFFRCEPARKIAVEVFPESASASACGRQPAPITVPSRVTYFASVFFVITCSIFFLSAHEVSLCPEVSKF